MVKKAIYKIGRIAGLLVFIFTLSIMPLFASNKVSAKSSLPTPQATFLSPEVIDIAQKFVIENKGALVVDKSITKSGLTSSQIAEVKRLVSEYNKLPSSIKQNGVTLEAPRTTTSAKTSSVSTMSISGVFSNCSYYSKVYWNWWGYRYFVNDCIIKDIQGATDRATFVSSIVSSLCIAVTGAVCTIVTGALLAIANYHLSDLNNANSSCGYKGAYINIPWTGPLFAWVSRIC